MMKNFIKLTYLAFNYNKLLEICCFYTEITLPLYIIEKRAQHIFANTYCLTNSHKFRCTNNPNTDTFDFKREFKYLIEYTKSS